MDFLTAFSPWHWLRRVAALSLAFACTQVQAREDSIEYAVKATFLYKFAPFVEWPAGAFASPSSPLVLCVAGMDPFGSILDRAVAGARINQRPIATRRLSAPDPGAGCHIVYLAGLDAEPLADALTALRDTPVLTVTDAASGSAAKGIIHFVVQENRVRFEINNAAAERAGIAMSSKLLSLATSVRQR